ncbi:MAG TPA: hypothetical protein DCO77_05525 [Nitrospiraceae bacterium]|nr:hypothetical protein [Nitrospiraceae bacterium]
MKVVFESHDTGAPIPVQEYLKNKKLAKYFNREAAAAVICATKLIRESSVGAETPFYYETGRMEFEDLGLDRITDASLDEQGNFSQRLFIEKGTKAVMPLTQFKALYNMPLSLVSIEHGLIGDNAVIYASARGLLIQALHAPVEKKILLGCGKVHRDGRVESAFTLANKEEIVNSPFLGSDGEGIEMFRSWYIGEARK